MEERCRIENHGTGQMRVVLGCLVAAFILSQCASTVDRGARAFHVGYRDITSPAGPGSGEPNISRGGDGSLYLSWIAESKDGDHALVYSKRGAGSWSIPSRIASGDNWIVNWADFPAIAAAGPNTILATWLERTGGDEEAYGVRAFLSDDAGGSWGAPFLVHQDSTPTEHGFVSLAATSSDRFTAIWLDGRETIRKDGPMTLRTATIDGSGAISGEYVLDPRVCDCCQTSVAVAGDGTIIVAYRDRSEDEVRDISVTRLHDGVWSHPETIHQDGWQIAGCPVNGPAVAASDSLVAIAWFTVGSKDVPAVNVVFSRDYGRSFGELMRVDADDPLGRVDVVFCDSISVVVCWIENGSKDSHLMIQRVGLGGQRSDPIKVCKISPERESGFPHLGSSGIGGEILLAWTDTFGQRQVKVASLEVD